MTDYPDGFEGVMIECSDEPIFDLRYSVPGWKCKTCGWVVGSQGAPPPHECPTEGIQQHCKHQWGETVPADFERHYSKEEFVQRQCQQCAKIEYRFVDQRWLD